MLSSQHALRVGEGQKEGNGIYIADGCDLSDVILPSSRVLMHALLFSVPQCLRGAFEVAAIKAPGQQGQLATCTRRRPGTPDNLPCLGHTPHHAPSSAHFPILHGAKGQTLVTCLLIAERTKHHHRQEATPSRLASPLADRTMPLTCAYAVACGERQNKGPAVVSALGCVCVCVESESREGRVG